MRSLYILCIISAVWLKTAYSAPVKDEAAESAEADDAKLVERRSVGKANYPAFGSSNRLSNSQMVDWNQLYNKKREAAKRFALQGNIHNGLDSHGLKDLNMLDWERVFNKRQWRNSDDDDFGAVGSLSNPEMENWSKFFVKKRAFGSDSHHGLGDNHGLESPNLQDWSSLIGRRRRNTDQ